MKLCSMVPVPYRDSLLEACKYMYIPRAFLNKDVAGTNLINQKDVWTYGKWKLKIFEVASMYEREANDYGTIYT